MTDQPTTTLAVLPAQVTEMQRLPQLLEKNIPIMEKRKVKANAALDEIPVKITSKDEAEDANAILAAVRDVYNANKDMRMEMTNITDGFKDMAMEYERDFNPDAKAKSKYNEKKKVLEAWQQEEHDRVQKEKQEAAKRKELENLKVDLKAQILQNLSNNVIETVKIADQYARNLFAALEPGNFDQESEKFKKQKPKLKQETYDKCFEVPWNTTLMTKEQYGEFCASVKAEETYDRWNAAIQEAVAPVLNEWRARIPDLKQEMLQKHNASEEERVKLDKERADRDEQEKKQRQEQLDMFAKQNQEKIQEDAGMQKISNSFAEQGVVQQAGDAGRTKRVLKFSEAKQAPTAFMNILYHVLASPKFQEAYPVFQKRDAKTKKLLFDDKQRPIYIDQVQWFIDFFLDHCDALVPGTSETEDAKVTIRK